MNNRTTILVLSAVLIAAVLSGCMQETSEIRAPGGAPQSNVTPPAATPDAAQPAPVSEVITSSMQAPPCIANWKYVSYRNLSISNAPALNQTARITCSIIPDKDIEILRVGIALPDGFVFLDANGAEIQTKDRHSQLTRFIAYWYPTNLSKDMVYQFNATIEAVETGNWTIRARGEKIYLSVSEDSAYIRDEPFPYIPRFISRSQFEKELAEQNITPSRPSDYNVTRHTHPRDSIDSKRIRAPQARDIWWSPHYWNGTAWVEGEKPVMSNQS